MSDKKCPVSTLPSEGKHMSHYCELEAGHTGEHKYGPCELCKNHIDSARVLMDILGAQARFFMMWNDWLERTKALHEHVDKMEGLLIKFLLNSDVVKEMLGPEAKKAAEKISREIERMKGMVVGAEEVEGKLVPLTEDQWRAIKEVIRRRKPDETEH